MQPTHWAKSPGRVSSICRMILLYSSWVVSAPLRASHELDVSLLRIQPSFFPSRAPAVGAAPSAASGFQIVTSVTMASSAGDQRLSAVSTRPSGSTTELVKPPLAVHHPSM